MQIWPAIDLRGGMCVRLKQGDYNRETIFSDNPAIMAAKWRDAGTRYLHLVDLDGARDGEIAERGSPNTAVVEQILKETDLECQLGGGVRSEATIERWLKLGLKRVIVGTRALREPDWFVRMAEKFPKQLVLGVDARDGMVATDGWLKTSDTSAVALVQQIAAATQQVAAIVYTDIAKDGMMSGPNFQQLAEMRSATSIPVVASGGVSTLQDLEQLAAAGTHAAIIGRALYDGSLDLAEAIQHFQQ